MGNPAYNPRSCPPYTPEEDAFILAHDGKLSRAEIARHLGRPHKGVNARLWLLRRRGAAPPPSGDVGRHYTAEEDAYIIKWAGKVPWAVVAAKLERPYHALWNRADRLVKSGKLSYPRMKTGGPKKAPQRLAGAPLGMEKGETRERASTRRTWHRWTPGEDALLFELWGKVADEQLAALLHRTVIAVMARARNQRLRKRDATFTAAEVARIFGVDRVTPQRWIARGWLVATRNEAVRWNGTNWWDVTPEAIEMFIREHADRYDRRRISKEEWPEYRAVADRVARARYEGRGAA